MGSDKSDPAVRRLRDQAEKFRSKGKHDKALEIYRRLTRMEAGSSRWPHMAGEVCQRMGRVQDAVEWFLKATERYTAQGMDVKALALAKVILGLKPGDERARAILGAPPQRPRSRLDQLGSSTERGTDRAAPPAAHAEAGSVESGGSGLELDPMGRGAAGVWSGPAESSTGSGVYSLPGAPERSLEDDRASAEPPPAGGQPKLQPIIPRPPSAPINLKRGDTLDGLELREVVGSSEHEVPGAVSTAGSTRSASMDEMDRASMEFERVGPDDDEEETSVVRAVNASEVPLEGELDSMLDRLFPSEVPSAPEKMGPPPVPEDARRAAAAAGPWPGIGSVVVPNTPLFGELEPAALGHMVARMDERRYKKGDVLVREGDPGGALYVVVEGTSGVYKEGPPRVKVGEIPEGGFFGEISIITNTPRTATVMAETDMRVLEISKEVVVELIQEHPEVVPVLMKFFRRRMVESLLKTSPLFTNLDNATRRKLARHFKFLETDPGLRFIKQGRPTPGLFVLLSGEARVTTVGDGQEKFLAKLGPGDLVGEGALLTGKTAMVSVEAVKKCWMVYMSAKDFRTAASTVPEMVTYLMNLTNKRRRAAMADRRAGVEFPVERLPVW